MPPLKFIIRETSVWKVIGEIKQENVLPNGYLDLSKVSGLRVYCGKLIKRYRKISRITQDKLAKCLKISRNIIGNWELDLCGTPFDILVEIAEFFSISKEALIRDIIELDLKFSMRTKPIKLPIHIKQLTNKIYKLFPYTDNRIYVKGDYKSSKILNIFLRTFFEYNKEAKIKPPLSHVIKSWMNLNLNIPITILFITEGSYYKPEGIIFLNNCKILHDILVDCVYFQYHLLPTSYFIERRRIPKKSIYITEFYNKDHKVMIDSIISLVGNLKTSPHDNQTVEEYLNEPQPNLDFIKNSYFREKIITLQLFLATEGSVYISRHFGYVYPIIEIGCAHPKIVEILEGLTKYLGLNFKRQKSKKTWSGLKGVRARGLSTALKLLKMNALIEGIKISSKSKYFEGFDKMDLLLAILELHRRQEKDKELFDITISQINKKVFEILKNKEYKSSSFYIKYFTRKKKVKRWL